MLSGPFPPTLLSSFFSSLSILLQKLQAFRFAAKNRDRATLGVTLKIAGRSQRPWPQSPQLRYLRGRSDHGT